jgi:cysteine desulfuration protein SufE
MTDRLREIIDAFAGADDELRLELLLDFSRRLPPLPARLHARRDAGLNRVHECMTPVFMWIESENGAVHMHVEVAEEAPTVQGFLAILIDALDGARAESWAGIPMDLLARLGLSRLLRMNRAVGLNAILGRVRRQAGELAGAAAGT